MSGRWQRAAKSSSDHEKDGAGKENCGQDETVEAFEWVEETGGTSNLYLAHPIQVYLNTIGKGEIEAMA